MPFLASVASALGIAKSAKDLIKGAPSPVLSDKDNAKQQRHLNQNNPQEINRQSKFLEGVAPSQARAQNTITRDTAPVNAEAHNTFQDITYGEDTKRQKARLDTLYEGTSPWERLGSSAASPLPSPQPRNTPGGQPNSGANPQFLAAMLGNKAQLDAAKINARTATNVATINADTTLKKTKMETGVGAESNNIKRAELVIKRFVADHQKMRWAAMTQQERESNVLKTAKILADILPQEEVNLPWTKARRTKGWEKLASWLDSVPNDQKMARGKNMPKNLPSSLIWAMYDDLNNMGKSTIEGAKGIGSTIGKFLGN